MRKKSLTPANSPTCRFPFADGRHCQMPVASTHPYLCLFHADRERRLADQARFDSARDSLVAELTSLSSEIKTANDLNRLLTRLWSLVVARRIDRLTATNLAYIASLILQSLPGVKAEIKHAQGYSEWDRLLRQSLLRPAQPPAQPTSQPISTNVGRAGPDIRIPSTASS